MALAATLVSSAVTTMANADEYDVKKGPTDYSSISDEAAFKESDLPQTDGVTGWRFSNGAKTTGEVVYDAGASATKFRVIAILGSPDATGNLGFEVSADNQNWTAATATPAAIVREDEGWPGFAYTGAGEEPFRYLKVKFLDTAYNWDPAICNVYFKTDATVVPEKPDNYNNRKEPSAGSLADGHAVLQNTEDANGYYTLRNADKTAMANGSITFQSKNPITDYNFTTLVSTIGWNGTISFAASKDGSSWETLSPTTVKTEDHSNTGWGAAYYDNFGTLAEGDGYRYLRATISGAELALPFPALGWVEYNSTGLPDGILEESENIANLELPTAVTDFSKGHRNGMFKTASMDVTTNATENVEWIGAAMGLVALKEEPSHVIMYTPNVRDFTFVVAYSKDWDKVIVRAYGRTTQYGDETEIPLMRTGNLRDRSGFPHYLFRPADRNAMAKDYEYIRIEIQNGQYSQMTNFTYYYDGPEPGDVPDDEQNQENPNGTDRTDVISYNFIKNNFTLVRSENFGTHDTGTNADYIGVKMCYVIYPDADKDAYMVFPTEGISNFYLKVNTLKEKLPDLEVKFLVAPSDDPDDESNYVEIPVKYELLEKQPAEGSPYCTVEYMPADDAVIPEGSNFLKVLVPGSNGIGNNFLLSRLDYEYNVPDVEPLPDFKKPDAAKGEKEMREDLSGTQLLVENGGKAEETSEINWTIQKLGGLNGEDKVLIKDNYVAESYLVYKTEDVTFIDVRGYRSEECQEDLLISVSADGESWTALSEFERLESKLYGGPIQYAHRIVTEDIPAGMNYVKVEIPELAGEVSDLTISDIQILYNVKRTSGEQNPEKPNPETGSALPAAALLLAGMSGIALLAGRKRRTR